MAISHDSNPAGYADVGREIAGEPVAGTNDANTTKEAVKVFNIKDLEQQK